MLVTPQDVTKFTPRLSPRAEQYEGTRLVFRIGPRSSSGSAFPIESGSDFAIGIISPGISRILRISRNGFEAHTGLRRPTAGPASHGHRGQCTVRGCS